VVLIDIVIVAWVSKTNSQHWLLIIKSEMENVMRTRDRLDTGWVRVAASGLRFLQYKRLFFRYHYAYGGRKTPGAQVLAGVKRHALSRAGVQGTVETTATSPHSCIYGIGLRRAGWLIGRV